MAIFELEIADEDVDRVFNAVCGNYGYVSEVPNPDYNITYDEEGGEVIPTDAEGNPLPEYITNPESQGMFVHRKVREFLSQHVTAFEMEEARKAAAAAVNATVTISDPNPT